MTHKPLCTYCGILYMCNYIYMIKCETCGKETIKAWWSESSDGKMVLNAIPKGYIENIQCEIKFTV